MKNKKYWVLAVILGMCASVIWAVDKTEPQNSPQVTFLVDQKDTLKGLQGVGVVVGNLKPEVEKYGLTVQQLQTDVELRLRQNGIRVLSQQELLSTPGMPCLYVGAGTIVRENLGFAAFSITLELHQNVYLARDRTKFCNAPTWQDGWVGSVGVDNIKNIRESIKDLVDNFINDYLAANPKEQPKAEHG